MAEEETTEIKEEPKGKEKKSGGNLKGLGIFGQIVVIFIMAWLFSISVHAFIFFVFGMLPSIFALMVDRGTGRFTVKTVTACNLIAVVPYLFDIGLSYEKSLAAKQLVNDTSVWIVIYSFSAIGWMMVWIIPQLSMVFYNLKANMIFKRLENENKEMVEEWGEEVKTGAKKKIQST